MAVIPEEIQATVRLYLGAPFIEEGDLQGLFDAIDVIVSSSRA